MAQAAFSGSVWCRRCRLASACSDRLRNGSPHVRLAKPGLTTTCNDSHRKPAALAKKLRLERTASRQIPLSRILAPRRRSTASSTAMTSGSPSGTNAACNRPSRIFAPCRPDHCAHERNRWNRLKPLSAAPSIACKAAHIVRRFIFERSEAAQKVKLLDAEQGDLDEVVGSGQHRKQAQQQDLVERVGHLALLTRILEVIEMTQKYNGFTKGRTAHGRAVHGRSPSSESRISVNS